MKIGGVGRCTKSHVHKPPRHAPSSCGRRTTGTRVYLHKRMHMLSNYTGRHKRDEPATPPAITPPHTSSSGCRFESKSNPNFIGYAKTLA